MSIDTITSGDKVKCIASEICPRTNCDHHGVHRAQLGDSTHHRCDFHAWCNEIGGWVRDKIAWDFLENEDCECDPNVMFRRKKG